MYLSKIEIHGFRNFPNNIIEFNDGVNVIIGHNNAGKTSLLKAIGLLINNDAARRLEIDDFAKKATLDELKAAPPTIKISLTITQSIGENLDSDDLVTVANWLTKLEDPYNALLTYKFYLPLEKHAEYLSTMATVDNKDLAWHTVKHDFLRYYNYRIYGGDPTLLVTADSESLNKFDFQFLNAIRDVERDMLSGKNTLLRDVLDFFMDYEIKSEVAKTNDQKLQEIKEVRREFTESAGVLITRLQERMQAGKEHILSYANETGATFNNARPDFDGAISDVEMYSALKLIVGYEALDIKIPASHNGLGYNNLIFMSLLLAKMQVNADGNYLGGNAKVFPVLAIEEPEAHLHPAMQYKFLKFLKDNKNKRKVRQIFVTTHSTQITSAVSLDEIICLHNQDGVISVGYPGKTFPDTETGRKAKAYVQRFLDATRSDMLFAQKIIFVEGLAEQLLIPTLAKCHGKNLEDFHTAIIPVGGRYFDNFLFMFDTTQQYTIPKKVICLKDRDPERKRKAGGPYSSCFPFLYNQDNVVYDYKDNLSPKIATYLAHPNIRFFGQNHSKGKTFEYELSLSNTNTNLLLTSSISNRDELLVLQDYFVTARPLEDFYEALRQSESNEKLIEAIQILTDPDWSIDDKKKAIIASRYLASVGKGENALELANALERNLMLPVGAPEVPPGTEIRRAFTIPTYITDSIDWLCQ